MKQIKMHLILCLLLILMSACGQKDVPQQAEAAESSSPEEVLVVPSPELPSPATPETASPPAQEPTAELPMETPGSQAVIEAPADFIYEGYQVLLGSEDFTCLLSDGNYWTKKYVRPDGDSSPIRIKSDAPFSCVYIEWDAAPGPYSLVWDGGSLECGKDGFIHEYVRLPNEISELCVRFDSQDRKTLCDIRVLSAGSPPEGVQEWQPPCEKADILVFPTHSDDDVLFFGPLISYYTIERELTVQTAFMVEHLYYPERDHERLNGLWEMGVRHYPILGAAPDTPSLSFDEGMYIYADSDIEQWQVEQIRRFKPLVTVGHDLEGEYGNAGHRINAHYLVRAVESAADASLYPASAEEYGVWSCPKLYLHLYPENEITLDVEAGLERDPEGRSPFEIAVDAFKCHISQHKWAYRVQFGESRDFDCRFFGLYRSLVGADTEADIMQHTELFVP